MPAQPSEDEIRRCEDPRKEEAVFGRMVEDFLTEDEIGQYLVSKAQADLQAAYAALVEADPHDAKVISTLQLEARVANRVRGWLAQAIENGRQSAALLQQEHDTHGD